MQPRLSALPSKGIFNPHCSTSLLPPTKIQGAPPSHGFPRNPTSQSCGSFSTSSRPAMIAPDTAETNQLREILLRIFPDPEQWTNITKQILIPTVCERQTVLSAWSYMRSGSTDKAQACVCTSWEVVQREDIYFPMENQLCCICKT